MIISGFVRKLRGIAVCVAVVTFVALFSNSALADYQQAKNYFDDQDTETKITITLRVCSRIEIPSQSPCHELDHCGLDKGQAGLGEALDIL